ncbi:hypothetical protein P153DRAFT_356292 [Dothidotthia symphoricarpi CBS 119687]|uniref:Uncharacterized protein n=1 Tax=Dothidotthia symphoricarpi CBS 119687 TaxID=1392245 RepID=A0A6A6AHJ0_9PLEO|nr:uncharacterized protein P153DRAFT_356292 [Dothidotthia symphoricarpi CBS 119687]KAF2130548.1 hypothetical protein P153DRAFT_356292 [Dothidotthia symphoricarpi CBS 119687]
MPHPHTYPGDEEQILLLILPLWGLLVCLCFWILLSIYICSEKPAQTSSFTDEETPLLHTHVDAATLRLPPIPHPTFVVHVCVALESRPGRYTPLFAFPHSLYIGVPGEFYVERGRWNAGVGHARRQGRAVRVRCYRWDGTAFTVPVETFRHMHMGAERVRMRDQDVRVSVRSRSVSSSAISSS